MSSFQQGHSNSVAVFPISPHDRYHFPLKIRGGDGQFHTITVLADAGNDVTLLRTSTAKQLGFDPATTQGEVFPVAGITAGPQPFTKIWNLIQIGDLRPTWVRMGLAHQEQSLAEDLLGRQDVYDSGKYEITYDADKVIFREKHAGTDITDGEGGQLPYSLREAFRGFK